MYLWSMYPYKGIISHEYTSTCVDILASHEYLSRNTHLSVSMSFSTLISTSTCEYILILFLA